MRLLARLVGLCLLGWVAYHGSVFLAVEVSRFSAWLLIPVLALGVVARLATVVLALRAVAEDLDAPRLLRQVAPAEAVDDDRDRSLVRLMTITLLPFLGVYAAFGYVNVFAQDVVTLSSYRFGVIGSTLLTELNPLASGVTAAVTVALVIGLYVGRRLLDRWHDRSGHAWVALLAVLVEACGLFVVLLSGFRLWEAAQLWLGERRLAQWWGAALDWASGWLRIDVPEVIAQAWAFVAGSVWPVFWDLLSQPIAWLALAALVFGSRVLSLGDLWQPRRRSNRLALHVQDAFLGDVDDKYLPSWIALRFVLRAGFPFLGAFVMLFGALRLAVEWTSHAIVVAIGGAPPGTWIRLGPFLDLLPNVVGLSMQLALLGAAYVRVLELRAGRSATTVPGPRHRLAEAGVVGVLLVAITGLTLLNPSERTAVRTVAVGQPGALLGGQVLVEQVRLGSSLVLDARSGTETTPLVFVVVDATVVRPGAAPISASADLISGDRTYHPGSWSGSTLTAEPGFRSTSRLVFEVQPADLGPALEVRLRSPGFLTFYDEVVRVPLGIEPGAPVGAGLPVGTAPQKAVA